MLYTQKKTGQLPPTANTCCERKKKKHVPPRRNIWKKSRPALSRHPALRVRSLSCSHTHSEKRQDVRRAQHQTDLRLEQGGRRKHRGGELLSKPVVWVKRFLLDAVWWCLSAGGRVSHPQGEQVWGGQRERTSERRGVVICAGEREKGDQLGSRISLRLRENRLRTFRKAYEQGHTRHRSGSSGGALATKCASPRRPRWSLCTDPCTRSAWCYGKSGTSF